MSDNPFAGPAAPSGGARQSDLDEANSFISTKTQALQFPQVGFKAGGTILDFTFRDDVDQKTGDRKFWLGKSAITEREATDKGYPQGRGLDVIRVMVMTLQGHDETLRGRAWEGNTYDPITLEDDDLIRAAWVRGSMRKALAKALQDAGVPSRGWAATAIGAHILWTRGPDGPRAQGAQGRPHTHTAVWTPADRNPYRDVAQANDDPWAQSDPAQTVPAAGPSPWDSAPVAAAPRSEPPF
jgi:hypothetical protein